MPVEMNLLQLLYTTCYINSECYVSIENNTRSVGEEILLPRSLQPVSTSHSKRHEFSKNSYLQ
jgi:hypothetical protein